MGFVWFWTFWHWSKESFRAGLLLRSPLHGIGGHWDEWFRSEAAEHDLRAITAAGRSEASQRQFMAWIFRHWAPNTEWRDHRMVPDFVLSQLAQVPPFNGWSALETYRAPQRSSGVSAIILRAESRGEAEDVRPVEAILVPGDNAPKVVSEGFQAQTAELEVPWRAVQSLFSGKGFLCFAALWLAGGARPYPRAIKVILGLSWLAAAGVILYLLLGPEPGKSLLLLSAALMVLWCCLVVTSIGLTFGQCFCAWRQGRRWSAGLDRSQIRLHMSGGLTIKGASAGLPFCLNMLLSVYRADPVAARGSWLWDRLLRKLQTEASLWAATGVVTSEGYVRPVVIEPKLRASLQTLRIRHLLTPRQGGAVRRSLERISASLEAGAPESAPMIPGTIRSTLGFAAEPRRMHIHRCGHVAQALMAIGGFSSGWQKSVNALALAVTLTMVFAVSDLGAILRPPPVPDVVAPASPSPYYLWVSLNTKHPERFQVVLESSTWSNRRTPVAAYTGGNASVRAELFLHRQSGQASGDGENGTIWIERRYRFLTREYAPGERVGRYSVAYVNHLGHE